MPKREDESYLLQKEHHKREKFCPNCGSTKIKKRRFLGGWRCPICKGVFSMPRWGW